MRLKSCVSTIKVLDPDTTVSYGRTFRTEGKTRMGVLPIGYADGFFRGLSNRMAVQTAYGPAPQRGRICMDMCMVDLTDLPEVKVGDTVEIFGQTQSVDSLAAILNTIPLRTDLRGEQAGPQIVYGKRQGDRAKPAAAVSRSVRRRKCGVQAFCGAKP